MSDLSDEENYSDASGGSSASGTRLTARQRAKEMGGENGMELQSLPNRKFSFSLSYFIYANRITILFSSDKGSK